MRWNPLSAVLLGLLMIGVTVGSASAQVFPTNIQTSNVRSYPKTISLSATNLYQFRPLPPIKPEVFLDKDQVDLRFSKYSSYVQYGGRIYLAFGWILDTLGIPNAGSPDRVSLLIPWEIRTPSQGVHLFEEDDSIIMSIRCTGAHRQCHAPRNGAPFTSPLRKERVNEGNFLFFIF